MSAASGKARPDSAVGNRARTAIGWASGGASPEAESESELAPPPEGEREGYETGAKLGASPGEVYEATHARLPGRFAIKFLTRARGATAAAIESFQTEAEQVSVLRHPNIVEVIELGVMPDGTPILVMEHLEGRTLEEILVNSGPLALPEVVPTIKSIASALEAAHKVGVVHREVRPDNILIANVTGYELGFPKLLDFGVSRLNAGPSPGSNLATAAARYLAPEQARAHAGEVDARTDQYALAALAYRMLSGTDAFGGNDVISILYRILNEPPRPLTALARVDTTIDSIIRKAMSRDKRLRFDSVFVFAKALEDAAGMGSRMVRNPLLGVPTPSPVRFVPSTAPSPAPERPITGPVPTRSERSTSERLPERSERQSLSSERLAAQRPEDRTVSSDRLSAQRQERDDDEQDFAPERSSDRLSEQREERAFAPERSSDRLSEQRAERGERAFAPERSSDRLSEQRAPVGRDRGDNMWSSDRLPEQRSKDRSERSLSFRDTLSERFFAEGERKAEEGTWTAADLDDERPEGVDAFDDFDDVPRRRWPMVVGLAVVAAIVPLVVMYLPDLRLLISSRPSAFWNEPAPADQAVLPTTVPGLPTTAAAGEPAAAGAVLPGTGAGTAAPAGARAAAPVGNAAAIVPAAAPAPARGAPARAETPPARPQASAPAAAAPSTFPSAPARPAAQAPAPTQAAAPAGGWAQQQPAAPAAAPPAGGWAQQQPAAPAAAPPAGGWAQQQPAAAAPAGGWAQQPAAAPPAGGWQTAPAQPAAPAQPIQPTNSAAWAPVNPPPGTAPPAAREPRGEPASVPLRGYVWSPKERRLVPAN